jgi:hypothetical protein
LPEWIPARLTQLADVAPEGDGWLHEIELDTRLNRGAVGCP